MEPFYCLIHTPEAMTPELWVLAANNEKDAIRELDAVVREWPRLQRIELYRGETRLRTFLTADLTCAPEREAPPRRRSVEPATA